MKFVHHTAFINKDCMISRDLVVCEEAFIGDSCRICPRVKIGRYVMLAPEVNITGSDHRFDIPGMPIIFSGRPTLAETHIEDDVWVGYGVVIMAGVTVGRGSIIAARSVVTKDIPPYEIHAGIPAKKVRDRFATHQDIAMHDAMLVGSVF
ncbi:MAG: hypothetical protein MZV65_06980 [Chromatiales bacterium]|nr:hypothetical protein [Chromatiales bacterium]